MKAMGTLELLLLLIDYSASTVSISNGDHVQTCSFSNEIHLISTGGYIFLSLSWASFVNIQNIIVPHYYL